MQEFDNIYVGWGHKFAVEPYSPPQPPAPAEEVCAQWLMCMHVMTSFVVQYAGDDVAEAADPTREEEIAFEASKAEAEHVDEGAEEEEGDE